MEVWDYIFGQYSEYSTLQVILEVIAIIVSVISVFYSLRNSVLVFPFGIASTMIFIYLLYQWNLLGDMVINGYYLVMSIYGWYYWLKNGKNDTEAPITLVNRGEWIMAVFITAIAAIGIFLLYYFTGRLESWVSYIDMLTTGVFFAGMWLMAKRKLEHWLVLMVGNIISVPLYFYKIHQMYGALSLTALLYIFLSIIAFIGYRRWKLYQHNSLLKA